MNGYELSRKWFDWCFENPEKAKPSHTAIYFWMIELCNRFGWKEKFGIPTLNAMEATGIKSKNTYYGAFNDLIEWGFIEMIEKSKNQNTANIISIAAVSKNKSALDSANKSALDSATIQHSGQQEFSGGNIDKPINNKTNNQKQENEQNLSALNYLEKEFPSRFETDFLMKYKSQIENFEKFKQDFNDTMLLEKRPFDSTLFYRLAKFARNWIENQSRYPKINQPNTVNTSDKIPVG